jgi:hypothetical protein
MIQRGKLSFRAERIEGMSEIKRIFAMCGVTP